MRARLLQIVAVARGFLHSKTLQNPLRQADLAEEMLKKGARKQLNRRKCTRLTRESPTFLARFPHFGIRSKSR